MRFTTFFISVLILTRFQSQSIEGLCNTIPFANGTQILHTYIRTINDDYDVARIKHVVVSWETSGVLYYLVKDEVNKITSIRITDISTGMWMDSCFWHRTKYLVCCIEDEFTLYDYTGYVCKNFAKLTIMSDSEARVSKVLTYRSATIVDWGKYFVVITYGLRFGQGFYVSMHPNRDDGIVCPQFARSRQVTSAGTVADALLNTEEKYGIEFESVSLLVPVEEYKPFWARLCGFATDNHIARVWSVYYNPTSGHFNVQVLNLTQIDAGPQYGYENEFTLSIQWHSHYRENIRFWNETVIIGRYTSVLLFLIHQIDRDKEVHQLVEPLLRTWIVEGNQSNLTNWPDTLQSTAMRLIALNITRDAVFEEGQSKVIYLDSEDVRTVTRAVQCYKRFSETDVYKRTDRLVFNPEKSYFEIRNLTTADSGMYMCKNPPGSRSQYELFSDYYIIVLPRSEDVMVYLTTAPLQQQDELVDSYPYYDVMNRTYLYHNTVIYGNCVYMLSKGLDNFDGFEATYKTTVSIKLNRTSEFHIDYNQFFLQVNTYAIVPIYENNREGRVVESEFTCVYHYLPNTTRVRHYAPVPDSRARVVKSRKLVAMQQATPLIISNSISTNQRGLDDALRQASHNLSTLFSSSVTDIPRGQVIEGSVQGEYVALVSEFTGWTSVFLFIQQNRSVIKPTPCSFQSYKRVLSPQDSLLGSDEMRHSHTLIAKQVQFKCLIAVGAKLLVLSAYNSRTEQVDSHEVENMIRDWIGQRFRPTGKSLTFSSNVQHTAETLVRIALRIVQLEVLWHATVKAGSKVSMLFYLDQINAEQIQCMYSVTEGAPTTVISARFQKRSIRNDKVFELYCDNVTDADSGLYRCQDCWNCTSSFEAKQRRLVVLPAPSRLQLKIGYGIERHTGKGTLTDPIVTTANSMTVHCVYTSTQSISAKVNLTITHETQIPNSYRHLQLRTIEKQRVMETLPGFNRHVVAYVIYKPESHEYWNYARVSCNLQLLDLLRDPLDVLIPESIPIVSKYLYFTYSLTRNPVILAEFIQTTSQKLTKRLRHWQSTSVTAIFSNSISPPLRVVENPYQIDYVVFLGLPAGRSTVWTVSVSLDGNPRVSGCRQLQVSSITDPNIVPGLTASEMYRINSGVNFEKHSYQCVLNTNTVLLALIAFGRSDENVSVNATEHLMKHVLLERCRPHARPEPLEDKQTLNTLKNTSTTFRMTRLRTLWTASVNIGQSVTLLGYATSVGNLVCFYRPNSTGPFEQITPESGLITRETTAGVLEVSLRNVSYMDSGLYKCNFSEPCSNCSFIPGIDERELVVLPNSGILKMHLNHVPLRPNEISVAHFNQCLPDGTPYIMTEQRISVRCIYTVSPSEHLQPNLQIIYEMFDSERKVYTALSYSTGVSFIIPNNGESKVTVDHLIRAPNALAYKDHLRVTCRLAYRVGYLASDIQQLPGVFYVSETRKLIVQVNAAPHLFPEYTHCTMPGLLINWNYTIHSVHHNDPISAVQFQKSVSLKRLQEDAVFIHSIQTLGVPAGKTVTWTIFKQEQHLEYEGCLVHDLHRLDRTKIPVDLHSHERYIQTGARNFINITFVCTLQPQHIALAFVLLNSLDDTSQLDSWLLQLAARVLENVRLWIDHPTSTKEYDVPAISGLRCVVGIIRLNIGWNSNVFVGTPWKILIHGYHSPNIKLGIYYQPHVNTPKKKLLSVFGKQNGSFIGQSSAQLDHAGFYSCEVESICMECKMHECFTPRRLLVSTTKHLLSLHLTHRLLDANESIKDQLPHTHLTSDEQVFVYCVYLRRRGLPPSEVLDFSYESSSTTAGHSKTLPFTPEVKQWRQSEGGVLVVAPYRIKVVALGWPNMELIVRCSVDLGDQAVDPNDIDYTADSKFLNISRRLKTELRARPVFFQQFLETKNDTLQQWLRTSLVEATSPALFHQSQFEYPINEGTVEFLIPASLGVPKGWVEAAVFLKYGNRVLFEPCELVRQVNQAAHSVSSELLHDPRYDTIHDKSLVTVSFRCVLRRENFVLALTGYTMPKKLTTSSVTEQSILSLSTWLQMALDNPRNTTPFPISSPSGVLVTYTLAKLNIVWPSLVSAGTKISLLGNAGNKKNRIDCFYQYKPTSPPLSVGTNFRVIRLDSALGAFQLIKTDVVHADSALYSCNITMIGCNDCEVRPTIIQRRLVVIPDQSLINMFLTHARINDSDNWSGNYTDCDEHNQPFMYLGTVSYAHCMHFIHSGADWLGFTFNSVLYSINARNETKRLPVRHLKPLQDHNRSVLYSLEVGLNRDHDYGVRIRVECEWVYTFPEPIWSYAGQMNGEIRLKRNKTITVRRFIEPKIHSSQTQTDDWLGRPYLRKVDWQTETATIFHSRAYTIDGPERIIQMHLILTLGIPRGSTEVWTVYRHEKQLHRENCSHKQEVNLTDPTIPDKIKHEYYRPDVNENVVNSTWACLLRVEQIALFIVTQNSKQPLRNISQINTLLETALLNSLSYWLENPRDSDRQNILPPTEIHLTYRAIKVRVTWSAIVPIGASIRMLGYVLNTQRPNIQCFQRHNHTDRKLSASFGFHIIVNKDGFGFQLLKKRAQFEDSAIYLCSVGDRRSNQTDTLPGFIPRSLIIKPDSTVVSIYYNHKLVEPPTPNFTQYTKNDQPYLLCGEEVYVYCSYPQPFNLPETPNHQFQIVMIDNQTLNTRPMPKSFIRHMEEPRNTFNQVTQVYHIRAPLAQNIRGPLQMECSVLYAKPIKVEVSVRKMLDVQLRIKPILFEDSVLTSRSLLTNVIRAHLHTQPLTAEQFMSGEPDQKLLEGTVFVNYTVGLGIPKGWTSVDLLYTQHGLLRRRPCTQLYVNTDVNELLSSHSTIRNSDYFLESGGSGLTAHSVACALTTDVMAMLMVVMSYANPNLSPQSSQLTFYKSVFQTVEQWLKGVHTNSFIQIPQTASVHYSLFRLRVGWRAHISVGTPIVMYGFITANTLKNPQCFSRRLGLENANKTFDLSQLETFLVHLDRKRQSFELIKPSASAQDSGVYECVLRSCVSCSVTSVLIPHYLIVFPRQLQLHMHYSKNLVKSHTSNHTDWVYGQLTEQRLPFIYSTQTIRVICDYHIDRQITVLPHIFFRAQHIMSNSTAKTNLSHKLLGTYKTQHAHYLAVFSIHNLTCPKNVSNHSDSIQTRCELLLRPPNETLADINEESWAKAHITTRNLLIRIWASPSIITPSIQTDDLETTLLLQSGRSYLLTANRFLQEFARAPLLEGLFRLKFSHSKGKPLGWYGAVSIYNHSQGLSHHTCTFEYDYYWQENRFDRFTEVEHLAYTCILLPNLVALFIYTTHSPETDMNKSQFEQLFLLSVTDTIWQWLGGYTDSKLHLPSNLYGDYRVCAIPVGWHDTVNINEPILMYGLLDVQQVRPPVCFYGYQNSTNPLTQGKQFKVNLHQDYGYFELTKSHAELTDSGVYSCAFTECHSCSPLIGLGLRTLLVLPDSSALKLSLYLVPLSEFWDLRCPTGFVSRVAPGESIKVNCTHTVPLGAITNVAHMISHGVIGDPTTEVQLDQSDHLVLPGPLGSVKVRSSSTFQVPTFAQLMQFWFVRCRIPYDALLLKNDHSKRSSSGYLSVKQQFRILHKRRPRIIKHWIKVAESTVERSDVDLLDRPLDAGQFLRSGPPKRLNEDLLEVMFTVDLGEPRGWTFIRLYYVSDANLYGDKCALTKITNAQESGIKGGRITHTSYCPVQPEHVALLMTVVSLPEDTLTRELAETQLDQAILINISRWLGYNRLEDGVTGNRVLCFYYDYHLIRLKIGWNATVNVTEPIIMQGKLGGQRPDMITCFYQISDKYPAQPITDNFQVKLMQAQDMFQLIKPNASIRDTGVYFCNGSRSDNLTVYMGMLPRKLSVLPTTVQVQCSLTLDQAGKLHVNQTGKANNRRSYLHSNQTVYVQCSYDEVLDSLYDIKYLMTYKMMDNATGALFSIGPPKVPALVTVNRSKTFIQHIYQITTPTAQEYQGPIQVSCLSVFENLTSPLSINSRNGSLTVECHQWFTIQEEANGVLEIRTLSKNYEFQPVPLGSEFFCTGGNGMPRLSYVWTRIKSTLYEQDGTDNNWASLLPGDGGGWGGPKQPFVDKPLNDELYVDGALLRVPEDAKYRGMTYLYVCTASNVIHNVKHTISKEVHLSILICPTDRLQLDLVVLLETRLMAGCNILDNTYPDIRFYGYFYLTLVRQLVLGLPFGSDWASFSFVYRAKESRKMNYKPVGRLKYQNVKFERYWNRIGLAESLYSRTNRPSSGDSACLTPWIDLSSVLHEVNTLYEHGFTQNPVFWLTVDYFVELSNLTQILSEVMKLQKYGIRIILSLTHPLNETPFKEFNEKLTDLLKPINTMNILPHFKGTTDCHKCQWPMDSDIGRIERSELFDAVCRAAGSHLPKPIQPPRLTFSMPKNAWFHGMNLLVTCTASVVDTDEFHLMTELVVCLTDAITVSNFSLVLPSNVQRLHNACHQRLYNRKTRSTPQEPLTEPVSVTVTVVLQPNTSSAILLCYQRLGEDVPKLFDATSFVHTSVASVPTVISRPTLHYSADNGKSRITTGRFWCTFYGFFSDLEVLLLFVARTNDTLVPKKYVQVARILPQLQPGAHLTKAPLFWPELSEVDQSGEFVCLVRPMEPKEHASRSLVSLPETSALVKFSHPLPVPGVTSSTCPAAPVCQVTPNETSLISGDALNFRCSAKIVLRNNAIKMFYLTATSSFILCIPALNEKQWQLQQHVPCLPVAANDQDCTKALLNDPSIQTFYLYGCHVSKLNDRFAVLGSVGFKIKQLRIQDFHGHFFCQTLDLLTLGTSEESAIRERLTSSVYTIRFPLRPQITQFYFDRLNYMWICQVVGYPLPSQLASIDLVQAEPMWLGKQMEFYKVLVNRTQPSVQNEHLVPALIVTNTKQLLYTLSLVFQPTVPLVGGLTKGIVQLRCTFGEVSQLLRTKIGAKTGSYERLLHEPLLLKAGDVLNVVCTLKSTPDDPILHMDLHRLVSLNWVNYDLTVLTITFRSSSHLGSQSVHNTVQPTFSPIGPWVINGELPTRVRVLTVQTEQNRSVDISLLSSEVFDTAFYYCSGRSMSGSYHQTDLYFNLFHGGSKRITFGYQVSDRPNLWTSARKHVPTNEHLLLRCIAWSTNVSDRLVRQLNLGPITIGRSRAKIVYNGSTRSGLVLRVVEHSLIATAQSMWDRFDCELLDKERRHQVILSSPTVQCRQPVRLRWVPSIRSSYARSTVVNCTADQTCINMTFKWNWLAGPIPQLTMDSALRLDDHISRGGSLFLRKLPRSGTYLFRCSVSCMCANRTLSYSVTGELTVRPDNEELLHSSSVEIEDSELDELLRQQVLYEADESIEKLTRNFTDPPHDIIDKPQEEDEQMAGITQYTSEHLSGGPSNEEFGPEKTSTHEYLVFLPALMNYTNSQETEEVITKLDFTREQLDNAVRRTPENLYDLVMPQTTYNRAPADQVLDRQDQLVDEPKNRSKKWTRTFHPAIWPYRMSRLHTASQVKPSFEIERLYPPYLDLYTDVLTVAEDSEELEHVQRIRLGLAQSTKRNTSSGRRRWFPRVNDTNLVDVDPYTTWLETYTNLAPNPGIRRQQLERVLDRRVDSTLFNHTKDSEPTGVAWNCHLSSGMYSRSAFDRLYCEDTNLISNKRKQKRKRYTHSEVDRVKNRLHLLDATSHFGDQAQGYLQSLKVDPMNVTSELVSLLWKHKGSTMKHAQTTRSSLDYRTDTIARWPSFDDNVGYTENLMGFHNQLLNKSWLKQIKVNHSFHNVPWVVDPVRSAYRPIVPPVSAYFIPTRSKDFEPSERLDLTLAGFDQQRHQMPWWSRLVHERQGNLPEVKYSALHLLDGTSHVVPYDDATKSTSGQWQAWSQYVQRMQAVLYGWFLSGSTENGKHSTSEDTVVNEVLILPGVAQPPGPVTLVCPVTSVMDKHHDYQFVKLTWFRIAGLTAAEESILNFGIQTRDIWFGSARFNRPEIRAYSFPPLRWSRAYTLDIKPLQIRDYGYYGCVNRYESTRSNTYVFNIPTISNYPLCTFPEQSKPRLGFAVYTNGSWHEVTSKIGIELDGHIDLVDRRKMNHNTNVNFDLSNSNMTHCFRTGDELIVFCELNPYRLFCEKADEVANGTRLISTELQAHLYLRTGGLRSHRVSLTDLIYPVPPIPGWSSNSSGWGMLIVHAWHLSLSYEHHGAQVMCEAQPRLQVPAFGPPVYWTWLNAQWNVNHKQHWTQSSKSVGLCVVVNESIIRIRPEPVYTDIEPHSLGLVQITPGQAISCHVTHRSVTWPTLTLHRVETGQVHLVQSRGVKLKSDWLERDRFATGQWPRFSHPNVIRMLVPSRLTVLGFYLAECTVTGTTLSKTFLLEVYTPTKLNALELNIERVWMAVTLPGVVLLYLCLRRYLGLQRNRTQHGLLPSDRNRRPNVLSGENVPR